MVIFRSSRIQLTTASSFCCQDITAELQAWIDANGIGEGVLVAAGQHTTTALVVNESEQRLLADIQQHFLRLAPPGLPYQHNDLHLRPDVPADEPRNAHAHLIALMLGNQLSLPVVEGKLGLGRYQSVLLVELDGPRPRQVLLQLTGVVV
ncbi:MAG: secondary thiamine-phosphate synthase enzyme YjbQ [Synechococcus lacustris]|jgi:secondary thiamine-phosphate synthase enzyme